MSIKTLRKRIALVAVSALGVGLLSVAPASAGVNTAVDRETFDYTDTGSVQICNAPTNDGVTEAVTNGRGNTRQVGEVLQTGTVAFTRANDDKLDGEADVVTATISGPGYWSTVTSGSSPTTDTFTEGGGKVMKSVAASGAITLPTGMTMKFSGTGTVQVTFVKNDLNSGTYTASTLEVYTFTVSSSCNKGSLSVDNSFVRVVYSANVATSSIPSSNNTEVTAAGDTSVAESAAFIKNGNTGYISARAMDKSSTALIITSSATWGASATNGAIVSFDGSFSPEASSVFTTTANGYATVYVQQGTANKDKPLTTDVTITYNGVELGKRTLKFTGKPTKIVIDPANLGVGASESQNILAGAYSIEDAAGNDLTASGQGHSGSANNAPLLATSGVVVDATQSQVTAVGDIKDEASGYWGTFGWTCGAGSGSAKIYLKYVNTTTLETLVSNTVDVSCAYGVRKYEASLDKATYAPGEIATLTITATDKNGKPVYDAGSAGTGVDLGTLAKSPEISLPQLTAVTAATWSDEFSSGKKTYKFTVGSTEGTYSGIVNLPYYNSTTYGVAAKTLSYKVAAPSTGAVTNAEVLAAIVKLIASINKQIRALQKSLRR